MPGLQGSGEAFRRYHSPRNAAVSSGLAHAGLFFCGAKAKCKRLSVV